MRLIISSIACFWFLIGPIGSASASGIGVTGAIVRSVQDPFPLSQIGFGLANDGVNLYESGAVDGTILVVDPEDLSVTRSFSTPASALLGLAYQDGSLYAVEPRAEDLDGSPSRIYTVDVDTGTVLRFFDAPSNTVVGLAFDDVGTLYGMDGYEDGRGSASEVYAFDPETGTFLHAVTSSGGLHGTDLIEWIDGQILTDDGLGSTGLSLYDVENGLLVRDAGFDVPGLPSYDWRGSTRMGDSLLLWSQQQGTSTRWLYEIVIVPEPSTALLLGLGMVALGAQRGKQFRAGRNSRLDG
jgi:hypothetical protein